MRAKVFVAALIVVVLIAAGITLFVSSLSGQRYLTDRIVRAVGGAAQTIAVKDIGGDWPSHIIWAGITVADRDGVWLTLDRFEVRLRPAALLMGRVTIDSAVIGTAHMLRQPVRAPSAQPSPPPSVAAVARTLSRITVRDLRIGALLLDPPVMGRAVDATLTGSLQDDPDSRLHTLALEGRLRREPGSLAVKFAAGANAAVLQVNGTAETLTAAGAITINNRSSALSGALKLNCRSESVCYAWPAGQVGALAAELVLAGTLASPQGTLNFSTQDLGLGTRRLPRLQGQVTARPGDSARGGVTFTGNGIAAGFPEALPEARPLVDDEAKWSFALTRAPDGALTLDSAGIESGDAAVQIAGFGLSPKLTPATLRLSLTGGARLLGLDDSTSRTDASLRIDRLEEGGAAAGRLTLATTGLPPSANLRPLLQRNLTFDADVASTSERVRLTAIIARSGETTVRGASAWTRGPRLDHETSMLTVTLPPAGTILPESTQVDVTLAGPLATIHADISATAPVVRLAHAPVRDAVISVALDRTLAGFTASLEGNGQWIDGPLAFSAGIAQNKHGFIDIEALSWTSPTVDIEGALQLTMASGLLIGELHGPVTDLTPLTTAFGAGSSGSAEIMAVFGAGDGPHLDQQSLEVTLAARNVQNAALETGQFTVIGTFDDLWGEMKLSTRAETADARLFGWPLAVLTVGINGTLNALKVELDAKGAADTPFSLASVTDITFGDGTVISVRRLAIRDGALKAELLAPARLTIGPDVISLADTRVAVQGGELQGAFTWNKASNQFDGALRAQDVALPSFTDIPGQSTSIVVTGEAKVSGPLSAVNGTAQLTAVLPAAKDQPPISLTAAVTLAGGRAKIDATAGGLSQVPARLAADVPARLNLASARLSVARTEPVTASLKWNGNLTPLWRLVPADVNVLAGDVMIDASLSGTLDAPVIGGTFNLSGGTYENLVGGTALRNIEARLGGDRQGGITISLNAEDMNDGSVTVSGRIAGDDHMTADITAELDRLDVLHRDDVIAAATGKITYSGPVTAGTLKGDVRTVRSLVRLGGSYMPEIPLLRSLPGFEPVSSDRMLAAIGLEIAVATDDPIRIEGEGLDSVWRGQLAVAGTLAEPDVRGTLTLDRGSFSFLGQSFALDRGTVTFTGGGSIDPQLNIVATREASDITATVAITGSARAPDVQLSSRPALPRDEILARLLFRKGTGELGPIESIQLASAASDLAGLSQGGINGVLRRTLGVDLTSGASGNSVMVGRQFGRNLYVSVGQSLTEQEREIVVEWRFSRSLSLKSTTSDVTGADIGVFWRKDY